VNIKDDETMKREKTLPFVTLLLLTLLVSLTALTLADEINPDVGNRITSSMKRIGPTYSELVNSIDSGSIRPLKEITVHLSRQIKGELIALGYEENLSKKEQAISRMYADYLKELMDFSDLIGYDAKFSSTNLRNPDTISDLSHTSKELSPKFVKVLDFCKSHGFDCSEDSAPAEQLKMTIKPSYNKISSIHNGFHKG
jgi:hypothetical protein